MGGYASIPLSGIAPPLQNSMVPLSQAAQQSSMQQENALRAQQTQQIAMQNQMTQMQMQQMQLWNSAMRGDAPQPSDGSNSQTTPGQPSTPGQPTAQTPPPTSPQSQPSQAVPLSSIPGTALPPNVQVGGMVPLSSAAKGGPQQGATPTAPAQQNAQAAPGLDPTLFGDRMADAEKKFLAAGGNPLWLNQNIRMPMIEQQTKLAALTKDQLANAKEQLQQEAGGLQAIAEAPDDMKAQMWSGYLQSQFQVGRLPKQQYQTLMNQGVPDDQHLRTLASAKLTYNDQIAAVEKNAQAQLAINRGEDFRQQAVGRDLIRNAGVALATLPDNSQDVQAWKQKYAPDNSVLGQNLSNINDPARLRVVLTRLSMPATEAEKQLQNAEVAQIQEGRNIASQGDPLAYGQYLGRIQTQNPRLYAQLPKTLDDDTPDTINALALTPQQTSQASNQAQNRDQRANNAETRATLAEARLALAQAKAGNLTPGQQATQQREDLTAKNKADAAEIAAWGLNKRYNAAAAVPDGQEFADPKTGVMRVMNPSARQGLQASAETTRQQAQQAHSESDQIQQRYGWGKYAPNAPQKTAAPTQTNPPATPNPNGPRKGRQQGQQGVDLTKLQTWANQKPKMRAFNRQTGAAVEWNGSAWVPAQIQ